jgi:hypothetical protein
MVELCLHGNTQEITVAVEFVGLTGEVAERECKPWCIAVSCCELFRDCSPVLLSVVCCRLWSKQAHHPQGSCMQLSHTECHCCPLLHFHRTYYLACCCRLWSKQAHHPSEADAALAGSSSTTPHGSVVSLQALASQNPQRQQQQQPNGGTHGGNHGHGH